MTIQPRWLGLTLIALMSIAGCDRFTSVETRMTRATASLEAGNHQAALIDVRKALDTQPDNIDAQLLLVDVLAASGETQSALTQLDRAVTSGATPAASEIRRIKLLLTLGDLENLKKALDTSTTLTPAQHDLFDGRLLLLARRPDEAQAAFERALSADPNLTDAALGRVEALATQGRSDEALQAVASVLTRDPTSGRAWILKGSLSAQAGDFTAAAQAMTSAIENGRGLNQMELTQAHALRIESHLAAGQLEAARSSLAALETTAGGSPITSLMRAKVALADRDTTTAVNELRKFTQAVPQHMTGRLLLASALLEQGSTEQALAEAVRNVAEFGDKDEPRLALAGIQLRLSRAADAEETLQPLIARSPPNPLAIAMMAQVRIQRGEIVAGVSLLEQSVAEQPGNARLQLQLAAAYLSTGEAKRALDMLASIHDNELAAARDRLRVIATAAMKGAATAEKELDAAVARHPTDVDLLLMAAAYQASRDHVDRARGYMQKALAVRPNDPMLMLALGRLELSAGRAAEAEALARSVLEKAPNDAAAMTLMAAVAAQRGQDSEVDAWLNRARVAKPDALDVRLALARRAMARGNNAEARSILEEAVRNVPTDATARIALAEINASGGRYADAMKDLREAAKGKPDSPFILLAMAKVQLAAKDTRAARDSLRRALELTPGWLPAAMTLAALETGDSNLSAALDIVQEVRRVDPEGAASFALEGDVYMASKRPADAAAAFAKAYRRTPGAALATRAAQAKSAAKLPAPEAELIDWLARTPDDALARRTLAEYLMAAGKTDAAVQELEKVVLARPHDYAALNNLAWLYQLGKDPRALGLAEKAYAGAPKAAGVADTYGWILVQTGDANKGLTILQQAATLAPTDPEIQFHLAFAASRAGERDRAVVILRRLVGSDSQFASRDEAQQLLAVLEQK
ncbi:MAG TPA: XrtA/PEP-CTERM system TPR-repeat protein PrsT [Povalibacter sp.]